MRVYFQTDLHLADPIETLYLRLIGDRSIQEKDFGRIQIGSVLDMNH